MNTMTKFLLFVTLATMTEACNQVGFDSTPQQKSATSTSTGTGTGTITQPGGSTGTITQPGTGTPIWVQSGFNTCSIACGGGVQTQTVTCQDGNGHILPDSMCTGVKPPSSQSCNTQACTTTYTWLAGAWGPCSVTCGGGTQTRPITCQNTSGMTVSNSLCNPATMPASGQSCNIQACSPVNKTKTITIPLPEVDFVLIIDDSMTNAPQIANLTQVLPNFFSAIASNQINWQACLITTDVTYANATAGQDGGLLPYAGQPIPWVTGSNSGQYVINGQTANLSSVLSQTASYIQSSSIYPGQGNAQGIGALYQMVQNFRGAPYNCFRSGATLTAILLSDKDENATYGNCNLLKALGLTADPNENFCEPPASYEAPATANQYITSTLNTTLVYNSIIVLPGDVTCQNQQTQNEMGNVACPAGATTCVSPAFAGNQYVAISNLTGGSASSICQSNGYASNLNGINQKVVETVQDVTLDCTPMAGTTPQITISPTLSTTSSVNGNVVSFNPPLPAGTTVTVNYVCPN